MSDSSAKHHVCLPEGETRLLLHVCCAPCCGPVVELLRRSRIPFVMYFCNPNIHPLQEYELRKASVHAYARKYALPFVDGGYRPQDWYRHVKGLAHEPERGRRCSRCFDYRLEQTARYAHQNRFTLFATCCGIARQKNIEQVHDSGLRVAARYPKVRFWPYNWRKRGGSQQIGPIARKENFYRQQFCGCAYSLRQTNRERLKKGSQRIVFGKSFILKKARPAPRPGNKKRNSAGGLF